MKFPQTLKEVIVIHPLLKSFSSTSFFVLCLSCLF